jgi:cytochrome P450
MSYSEMVQKEGLRMFGPITGIFFRRATVAHKLKDIPIPVGTTLAMRNRANMFKEEYFAEPYKFEPSDGEILTHR